MARLAVINSRILQEYEYYEGLWKEYEHVSAELHKAEMSLQSGHGDNFAECFPDLYSNFSSLMYKIEHMHNLLERLMIEADREEQEMTAHATRLKQTEEMIDSLTITNRKSTNAGKNLAEDFNYDTAMAGGFSLKSTTKMDIISSQGQSYGPIEQNQKTTTVTTKNPHKEFLNKYSARLSKEKEIQRMYDRAILEAEQKRENTFIQLMKTIKKINSENSIRVQRRVDEEEKRTAQRLKEINAFHEQIATNIEQGIVTTDNVYKKFREEDQKRLLEIYTKARKKQLALSKKIADEFATEMARRELQYHKDCDAAKRQAKAKAKSISSVNRSAEIIKQVTGLEDPCEVLYQSTRPKHLRDPVSVVAKTVVPPSVGLGLCTKSNGKKIDLSRYDAYKVEEEKLVHESTVLAKSNKKSSPSRTDPMSYLAKDPFYDILPRNTTTDDTVPFNNSDLQNVTHTSSKEQQRPSPTKASIPGKGISNKKEIKEVDFDSWSSSDDNEVALAYNDVPSPPATSFLLSHKTKTNIKKLPVAKPVVFHQTSEHLNFSRLASCPPGTLKTLSMPNIIQTQTLTSSSFNKSAVFLSHPSTVLFFDYAPGTPQTMIIHVTNVSPGLAAFKISEPEPHVLHLFKYIYKPGGSMASGAKIPVKITFTPSLNEKECLSVIDTFLTIKYQGGELHVPIVCYPRQIAILILKNFDLVQKIYKISISMRHSSPDILAAKAELIHKNINEAIISELGVTLSQTMSVSSLALNKDGGGELITLATLPHGTSREAFYLSNSGALPALIKIRLDACALHSSLPDVPVAQSTLIGRRAELQSSLENTTKVYPTPRLESTHNKQSNEKVRLTFNDLSSCPPTAQGFAGGMDTKLFNDTIPQNFRSNNISINTLYSYMQQATSSTSPRIPSKLYSTEEIEVRRQEIEAYDSLLNQKIETIMANNMPPEAKPPTAKSPYTRQRSPKAGSIQSKQQQQSVEVDTIEPLKITREDAIDMAINELGPRPEELSTELMVEALSNISIAGHNQHTDATPLLQIDTPTLIYYKGKEFNFEEYFNRIRKEKLKNALAENLHIITTQLDEERESYRQSLEQQSAPQKGKGSQQAGSSAAKSNGRPSSTRATKDTPTTNEQSSFKEEAVANTLLDPEFFKSELDKRVKEKTDMYITQWSKTFSILKDLLNYEIHNNIEMSVTIPPKSIVSLPVVHSPLRFLLDIILKINLIVKPIFPFLDKSDEDYAVLQRDNTFTNTLFINAYTLQSGVFALKNSLDYLTCFYNSAYNSEIQLRSVEANSRPIAIFVPTIMKTICSSSVSETVICKTTGDLHIKISLLCESKAELMRILSTVEQYQESVDYTDLEYTIKNNCKPPTNNCPLESWADISISGLDQYTSTLPSIVLGEDVKALNERLKDQLQELDSLLNCQRELETKLAGLLEKRKTIEDALQVVGESQPSSALPSGRIKEPAKGKPAPPVPSSQELQKLILECDQVSANLQTVKEQNIPLLQSQIANTKRELHNLSSVGSYIKCSFNILVRVSGQPEPIFIRLNACFTSSELLVKLPYTHPSAAGGQNSTREKSSILSQVTKTVRTMRTVGTLATRTNRTITDGYLVVSDTLDLQNRSSVNLGDIAMWHVTNVPVVVRNNSALPQHVALLTKPVPDVSLTAGPDNGTVLLYPGQEVRMHLGILPNSAKKFQVKCSIESEFGYIKNFTICATSMQPSLLCQSNLRIFKMSITDVLRIEQIYLRSTVNIPRRWSISPAFLQFISLNFNGLLTIKPTAGIVAAQSICKLSVSINTSALLLARLISFLDDQHADEMLKDLVDLEQVSRPASAIVDNCCPNTISNDIINPTTQNLHALGASSNLDIINYVTNKHQFVYITRRHLDPSTILPDDSSIVTDSEESTENNANEIMKPKRQAFVDQHLTINIPIITEDTASPFLVCPLNLLITRPIIVATPVPDKLCDGVDVAPNGTNNIPSISFADTLELAEGTPQSVQPTTQAMSEDPITKHITLLAESSYISSLLHQEALYLPVIANHNQSVITISFGYVPLGCILHRSAIISLNESLPTREREQYYGDYFQFERQVEEAFDSDIILTTFLGKTSMSAQKPLTLCFEYSPRRIGYTEETIELSSRAVLMNQRLNNIIIKLKGYGVKVTLSITLDNPLIQTDFPLPDSYNTSQSDIIYTESPPILLNNTSEIYKHQLSLTLNNENKYNFKYKVEHQKCNKNILQSATTSEGVVYQNDNVKNNIFIEVFGATESGGSLAITEIVSGDAKKIVICRCFASQYPVSMYFIGPVVTVSLQNSTSIYCGCAIGQVQAEFSYIEASSQLQNLIISPMNGVVQAGKMVKVTLSIPKLAFSGTLSLDMSGHISFKLTCGLFERTVVLPVTVTLS